MLSSSKRTPTLGRNRNSLDLNKNTMFLKVSILPPMDLFSLLPDHLISSILSHLPFHQAARTSTLSRRWRTLWAGITDVNITADHLSPGNTNKQIQYVDTIMSRPELNLVNNFHIKFCPTDEHHRPVLARWAEELARRGVSKLGLINVGAVYATVPCILSCKSLTVLKLRACKLDNGGGCSTSPPPLVGCTNLRSLDLEGVVVSDATIREVVSSSEYLESLNVQYCSQHKVIVHHQRLARFILRSRVCSCVHISAPNLEELELDVPSDLKRISVLAPRVRRSSIWFQWCSSQPGSGSLAEQLGGLLAGIASTKYLGLHGAVVKHLSLCISSWEFATRFDKLKRLRVELCSSDPRQTSVLTTLLRGCSQLEELRVERSVMEEQETAARDVVCRVLEEKSWKYTIKEGGNFDLFSRCAEERTGLRL